MKRSLAIALMITAGLVAISCGGDNRAPTAPTPVVTPTEPAEPAVPQVGGTYTGEVDMWYGELPLGPFDVTLTVTQSGNQVTVEAPREENELPFETVTGTLESDGTWTANEVTEESADCGKRIDPEVRGQFRNRTFEYVQSWDSTWCEHFRAEATLTRS